MLPKLMNLQLFSKFPGCENYFVFHDLERVSWYYPDITEGKILFLNTIAYFCTEKFKIIHFY